MKIVVLDGYTLNPGDLSWEPVKTIGDFTVFERTSPDQILERAQDAQVLFTNKTMLNAQTLAMLPELRYIGVLATGYNVVDIEAAKKLEITVTNVPAYSTPSVAQMTFSLLLDLCLHVREHSLAVQAGEWSRCADFCFWKFPLVELAGKTMGIIGYGSIGRRVAEIANAFQMRVITANRLKKSPENHYFVQRVDMDLLFRESDIVSLHCPLTPETNGIINRNTLALMKPSAYLINTSRGQLIVEQDLADALNQGRIAGAGVDVLSQEPPRMGNPLIGAKNCIITPHIAWASKEARARLMYAAVDNLHAWMAGRPVNVVTI